MNRRSTPAAFVPAVARVAVLGLLALAPVGCQSAPRAGGPPGAGMGQQLVEGMRNSDGCLGVETARSQSGKQMIIGWFRDKHAAQGWYYHPTHQRFMGRMDLGDAQPHEPLAHAPDHTPLMIIAALTPAASPQLPNVDLPVSQISIEIFAPVPGGAEINGRLSPATFEVPHLRDYSTSQPAEAGPATGASGG